METPKWTLLESQELLQMVAGRPQSSHLGPSLHWANHPILGRSSWCIAKCVQKKRHTPAVCGLHLWNVQHILKYTVLHQLFLHWGWRVALSQHLQRSGMLAAKEVIFIDPIHSPKVWLWCYDSHSHGNFPIEIDGLPVYLLKMMVIFHGELLVITRWYILNINMVCFMMMCLWMFIKYKL